MLCKIQTKFNDLFSTLRLGLFSNTELVSYTLIYYEAILTVKTLLVSLTSYSIQKFLAHEETLKAIWFYT